jgi:uncharacterized protein (DUF1778 family)
MAMSKKERVTKVRLSIDCSPEERKKIKLLATVNEKTISDYLLSLARDKMSQLSQLKTPTSNDNSTHSEENFWSTLGFSA